MTDLPIFTVADGIASLILRQIPARGEAYILVRAVFGTQEGLLQECAGVCRAAGAESIFVGGTGDFSSYPVYARLMERSIRRTLLPAADLKIRPVTPETVSHWAAVYHERFSAVPAAQLCTPRELRELPENGEAFFLSDEQTEVGIGRVRGDTVLAIAALRPGFGARVLSAAAAQCTADTVRLLCAMENLPAMKLYDRLGFSRDGIREIWHRLA